MQNYKTINITIAVGLVSAGEKLVAVEPTEEPGRFYFVFSETPSLQEALDRYFRYEVHAPIQNVIQNLRLVKARLKEYVQS